MQEGSSGALGKFAEKVQSWWGEGEEGDRTARTNIGEEKYSGIKTGFCSTVFV